MQGLADDDCHGSRDKQAAIRASSSQIFKPCGSSGTYMYAVDLSQHCYCCCLEAREVRRAETGKKKKDPAHF